MKRNWLRGRIVAAAGLGMGLLFLTVEARGASIPVFNAGSSTLTGTHDIDGAGGVAAFSSPMAPIPGTAALISPFSGLGHLESSGTATSKSKGGAGHTEASNNARITFPSGMGVNQVDPSHLVGASTFTVAFNFKWDIDVGTFGPPIGGTFSVPIGATVTAGGSASAAVSVHWDLINSGGTTTTDARAAYSSSVSYTTAGTYLTSFTAPAAAFSPSSLAPGGAAAIVIRGTLTFTANNDTGAVFIQTLGENPSEFLNDFPPGFFDDPQTHPFLYEPFGGFTDDPLSIPEPAGLSLVACMALGLLRRTRR